MAVGGLRWTAEVGHSVVQRLECQLTPSLGGGRGCTSTPQISIEVWAVGVQLEELVYCHAKVMARVPCLAEVEWLGRSSHRPAAKCIRGLRCVAAPDSGAQGELSETNSMTVAEALFGLIAALLCLFKVSMIELEVMDNGSGRLGNFYANLGFLPVLRSSWETGKPRKSLWMAAPAVSVAKKCGPAAWMKSLVPVQFDPMVWLNDNLVKLWSERALGGRLPQWSWRISWPSRAELNMRVFPVTGSTDLLIDASISSRAGAVLQTPFELVYCRCKVQLQQQRVTLLWLGRENFKSASVAIRGKQVFAVSDRSCSGKGKDRQPQVTAAVGLLGAMVTVAAWFGATTASMRVRDDGSGKLVSYFESFGFVTSTSKSASIDEATVCKCLCAPSDHIAQRCCPLEWDKKLLETEDLNRFATQTFKSAHLLDESAYERRTE